MRLFAIFLFCLSGIAQETPVVYVDENFKPISEVEFQLKLKADYFSEAKIPGDSVVYKKLFFNQYFGTLDQTKKSEIQKLFYSRLNLDTTKIWVIHYGDTLPDITTLSKRTYIEYLPKYQTEESFEAVRKLNRNSFTDTKSIEAALQLVTHKHHRSFKSSQRNIRRELRAYRKHKNALLLHFFNVNQGYPTNHRGVVWLKDHYKVIRKTFNDGAYNYKFIILYPNGDFFVSYKQLPYEKESKYLNEAYFNEQKDSFLGSTTSKN